MTSASCSTHHTHTHTHTRTLTLHCTAVGQFSLRDSLLLMLVEGSPVQSSRSARQHKCHTQPVQCAMCAGTVSSAPGVVQPAVDGRTGGGSDARLVMGRKRLQDNCLIYTLCLNKKTLNLASCSCDKHGLILITISTTLHQQTQLSLTNRATHLCKWNAVSDLLATCACLPICVIMPNVVVLR